MEYGKVSDLTKVDFSLPLEPAANAHILQSFSDGLSNPHPKVFLGATGYSMPGWKGKWYPAQSRPDQFLHAYSRLFNSIEHNSTHYRIPDVATVRRWVLETPADFRFCPKFPQSVSHRSDLGIQSGYLQKFVEAILPLGTRLGPCFLQLPPHFAVQKLSALEKFLLQVPSELKMAVEVRHPSFFDGSASADAYFDLLFELGMGAVITDVAGQRADCHGRLTADFTLIRLVGNGMIESDYARAQAWAERVALWFGQGLREAYIFCHQPDNLLAPDFCVEVGQQLKAVIPNLELRLPQSIQGSLF